MIGKQSILAVAAGLSVLIAGSAWAYSDDQTNKQYDLCVSDFGGTWHETSNSDGTIAYDCEYDGGGFACDAGLDGDSSTFENVADGESDLPSDCFTWGSGRESGTRSLRLPSVSVPESSRRPQLPSAPGEQPATEVLDGHTGDLQVPPVDHTGPAQHSQDEATQDPEVSDGPTPQPGTEPGQEPQPDPGHGSQMQPGSPEHGGSHGPPTGSSSGSGDDVGQPSGGGLSTDQTPEHDGVKKPR